MNAGQRLWREASEAEVGPSRDKRPITQRWRRLPISRFSLLFVWYNLWVGVFIDTTQCKVYVLPIPMVGFVFDYGRLAVKASDLTRGRKIPFWKRRLPAGWRWF